MVNRTNNLESIPADPDEIKVKISEWSNQQFFGTVENNPAKISVSVGGGPRIEGAIVGGAFTAAMNPSDYVKKSDMFMYMFNPGQIANPQMITIASPGGSPITLGNAIERLMRLESQAGTSAAGIDSAKRIDELEKVNLQLMERILALEEYLKDVPTSRPAW